MRGVTFGQKQSCLNTVVGPLSFAVLSSSLSFRCTFNLPVWSVCVCARCVLAGFSSFTQSLSAGSSQAEAEVEFCEENPPRIAPWTSPRVCHLHHKLYNQAELIWKSSSAFFFLPFLFPIFLGLPANSANAQLSSEVDFKEKNIDCPVFTPAWA